MHAPSTTYHVCPNLFTSGHITHTCLPIWCAGLQCVPECDAECAACNTQTGQCQPKTAGASCSINGRPGRCNVQGQCAVMGECQGIFPEVVVGGLGRRQTVPGPLPPPKKEYKCLRLCRLRRPSLAPWPFLAECSPPCDTQCQTCDTSSLAAQCMNKAASTSCTTNGVAGKCQLGMCAPQGGCTIPLPQMLLVLAVVHPAAL